MMRVFLFDNSFGAFLTTVEPGRRAFGRYLAAVFCMDRAFEGVCGGVLTQLLEFSKGLRASCHYSMD